eukprot:1143653-Pelagomonas_calceolata.AAC.1
MQVEHSLPYDHNLELACQGLAEAEGNQGLVAYADADNFQTGNYAYTARTLHLGCIELTSVNAYTAYSLHPGCSALTSVNAYAARCLCACTARC